MRTLRYLLMTIAILGVLSVNAQTHQYGATHYLSHEQEAFTSVQVNPQMPTATMGYTHSDYMTTGSTLPQAAVDGPTTTYDEGEGSSKGHIRKGWGGGGGGEPGDWDEPWADPIGDAAWPLLFCAAVFSGVIAFRRKRQQRNV